MLTENELDFKKNIKSVSIELNSNCNRKCVYCPHSLIKRPAATIDVKLLEKIIHELKKIEYNGQFCLNIYNEPLLHYHFLLNAMVLIKSNLPNCQIFFSTNGDYLTKERLEELILNGLSKLTVTCHQNKFDSKNGKFLLENMMKKLDLQNYTMSINDNYLVAKGAYLLPGENPVPLRVFSSNFLINGQTRANSLKGIVAVPEQYKRIKACLRPETQLSISYDGSVYPCCMFFHGLADDFMIGKCHTSSIFDLYAHRKYVHFKQMCSLQKPYESPCLECTE